MLIFKEIRRKKILETLPNILLDTIMMYYDDYLMLNVSIYEKCKVKVLLPVNL